MQRRLANISTQKMENGDIPLSSASFPKNPQIPHKTIVAPVMRNSGVRSSDMGFPLSYLRRREAPRRPPGDDRIAHDRSRKPGQGHSTIRSELGMDADIGTTRISDADIGTGAL